MAVREPRAYLGGDGGQVDGHLWLDHPLAYLWAGGHCAEGDEWTGWESRKVTDHSLYSCVPGVGSRATWAPPGAERGRGAGVTPVKGWGLGWRNMGVVARAGAHREKGLWSGCCQALGAMGRSMVSPPGPLSQHSCSLPISSSQPLCRPAPAPGPVCLRKPPLPDPSPSLSGQ